MRTAALQERRNRQILADIVRTYIESGEPVSSRAISARFAETLSSATIRNIMADLEVGGFLYQPNTSDLRVHKADAHGFFPHQITLPYTHKLSNKYWNHIRLDTPQTAAEPP